MYAIVKTGGKQYRVERGQTLLVERLPQSEGSDVELEPLLYRSEEALFDKAALESVTVTARVVAHVRGEKLRVAKFKPKRGYKRRTGHRQDLTRIEVLEISAADAKPKSKPARARAAKADAVPAGEGAETAAATAGGASGRAAAAPTPAKARSARATKTKEPKAKEPKAKEQD